MNRFRALLATALIPFWFAACSPYDAIDPLSAQPVSRSAESAAPTGDIADPEVWPLGVAP